MPKPDRNQIYESVIRRMVQRAMEEQERQFAETHGAASEQELLEVLREAARTLGHSPWPGEFPGGALILQRFGSWQEALTRAELRAPVHPNKLTRFSRYQEEVQRQQLVYRQQKAEKKQRSQERLRAQEANRRK